MKVCRINLKGEISFLDKEKDSVQSRDNQHFHITLQVLF